MHCAPLSSPPLDINMEPSGVRLTSLSTSSSAKNRSALPLPFTAETYPR